MRKLVALLFCVLAVNSANAQMTTTTTPQCNAMFGVSVGLIGTSFKWDSAPNDGTIVCMSRDPSGAMLGEPIWQSSHAYIFTGSMPSNEGTIGPINLSGLYPSNIRPTCIAQPAWTMPEFALGYAIPDWPMQATAVQASYAINPASIMVRFWSPTNLMPNSNYSVNIICAAKQS